MEGIKYIGPLQDFSGYSEASRNYVLSLHKKGIPVTVRPRNFDVNPPKTAVGEDYDILESLIDKNIRYDTVIIHLTPDLYPLYAESGKYNIGFMAWETTLLPPKWVSSMEVLDEIWVPCAWNEEALRNSGVNKPSYIIPHGIDPETFSSMKEYPVFKCDISDNTFKFYSIFQWMNRKNPEGLLRAYFNAFKPEDDVVLILKTYLGGRDIGKEKQIIRDQVLSLKKDMNIGYYPRVVLVGDILSRAQILGLHCYGDCCVSLHRGEGWGLPMFEAGLNGNPVIATACGGNLEFMGSDNSYLVDYQMTFVSMMSGFNSWYLGNQLWAEPNIVHASGLMRYVFDNKEEAKEKGSLLSREIKDKYSWDKVADIIIERLSQI